MNGQKSCDLQCVIIVARVCMRGSKDRKQIDFFKVILYDDGFAAGGGSHAADG